MLFSSKPERVLRAEASIKIDNDIAIIFLEVESNSLLRPPNLFITAIAPTNSTNKVVIATIADSKNPSSIVDNKYREDANIPIAIAILTNVPALSCS